MIRRAVPFFRRKAQFHYASGTALPKSASAASPGASVRRAAIQPPARFIFLPETPRITGLYTSPAKAEEAHISQS